MEQEERIVAITQHLAELTALVREQAAELDVVTAVVLALLRAAARTDPAAADDSIRAATQEVSRLLEDLADQHRPDLEHRLTLLLAAIRQSAGDPPQR